MSAPDRGTCPLDDKARFTYDEAIERVRKAKLRGKSMIEYRCTDGWWHIAHAGADSHGGGVQQPKRRRPTRREQRARRF